MWSSTSPRVRVARDVDAMIAAEWALEELHGATHELGGGTLPGEPLDPGPTAEWLEAQRREAEAGERDRLVAEAYERGYEEGRQAGETAESMRLRNAVAAAEQALDEVREGEMRWMGSIEENICALAVAIARQVIGRELREDAESVVDLVRRALLEFPVDQPVRIRVNPQDLAAIESHGPDREALITGALRGRDARWIADARLAPGGCVVEGRDRIVDGRVDTALERMYRRLTYSNA